MAAPNKTTLIIVAAIALFAIGVWKLSVAKPEPWSQPVGHVEVKTALVYINGDAYIDVQVKNKENVSICVNPQDYDSMFVRIPIYQDGKEVPYLGLAEPALFVKSSAKSYADVTIPYSILMPNDIFYGQYALRNFKLKKGPFKVKFILYYNLCSDLVDVERERRKEEPEFYPIRHEADFITK